MREIVIGIILGCVTLNAMAGSDSVLGTQWVKYQPIQVGGSLKGCQLVFLALTSDRIYRNGDLIAVNGSIVLSRENKGVALALKVGLKDMTKGTPFERPAFAYLQTVGSSTAKAKQASFNGEKGYRYFVYSATEGPALEVLKDMVSTDKVIIGYDRKIGGMDVLVPLDLTVVDSKYTAAQKVIRKHSITSVLGFTACGAKVTDSISGKSK